MTYRPIKLRSRHRVQRQWAERMKFDGYFHAWVKYHPGKIEVVVNSTNKQIHSLAFQVESTT